MAGQGMPVEVRRAYELRERNRTSKYLEAVIARYERGVKK